VKQKSTKSKRQAARSSYQIHQPTRYWRQPANFATGVQVSIQRQGVFAISTGSKALDAILGGISFHAHDSISRHPEYEYYWSLWRISMREDAIVSHYVRHCSIASGYGWRRGEGNDFSPEFDSGRLHRYWGQEAHGIRLTLRDFSSRTDWEHRN